ncbi:MAG: hypothetical protein ABI548_21255 [Polyangiaceae bacterium]
MKSVSLLSTGTVCLALLACSTAAEGPGGGGAGTGTSAGGAGDTAGAAPMGGSAPVGGSAPMGGSAPVGGSAPMGGDVGTGGAAAGAGTGGAAAGSTNGGAGGAAAGAGASGAGTGGGSAGGGALTPTDFGNGWDGALLQYPCGSGNPNYDCAQPQPCNAVSSAQPDAPVIKPSGAAVTSWTVKGTPGTMYNVQVHIQGVTEVSWYHNGTRSAGTSSVDVASTVSGAASYAKDLFQTGGTGLTFADQGNGFDYNQYELDVTPPGGTPSVYFLNSVIPSENPHLSGKTMHLSFEIDEMPTIKMAGGSTVSLTVRDSNCVQIQNCGTSNNNMCGTGSRSMTFAGAMPAPPASWTGKVTSGTGGNLNGQFVHFDITSVTAAP